MMNDINNRYCMLNTLSQDEISNLELLLPPSDFFDFFTRDTLIGFRNDGTAGTYGHNPQDIIVTYTEMMQLLKGKDMNKQTAQEQLTLLIRGV